MFLFDPDTFAVCGETLFTRVALPGLPLSIHGTVRETFIMGRAMESTRMVCFTLAETAKALGIHVMAVQESVYYGRIPSPKYSADRLNIVNGNQSVRAVNVYLYPEVVALTQHREAIQSGESRVLSDTQRASIIELKSKVKSIRETAEETIV